MPTWKRDDWNQPEPMAAQEWFLYWIAFSVIPAAVVGIVIVAFIEWGKGATP